MKTVCNFELNLFVIRSKNLLMFCVEKESEAFMGQRRLFWFCQSNHDLEQQKGDSPLQRIQCRNAYVLVNRYM